MSKTKDFVIMDKQIIRGSEKANVKRFFKNLCSIQPAKYDIRRYSSINITMPTLSHIKPDIASVIIMIVNIRM